MTVGAFDVPQIFTHFCTLATVCRTGRLVGAFAGRSVGATVATTGGRASCVDSRFGWAPAVTPASVRVVNAAGKQYLSVPI